jgi:hypothetical protein
VPGPGEKRTMAESSQPRPPDIRKIFRWLAVLPVTVVIYSLTATALIGAADLYALPLSGVAAYTVLFAGATLTAVCVGAQAAPARCFPAVCVLVLPLAAALFFLSARMSLSGMWDRSLPPVVLSPMAAGMVSALLVWWKERQTT